MVCYRAEMLWALFMPRNQRSGGPHPWVDSESPEKQHREMFLSPWSPVCPFFLCPRPLRCLLFNYAQFYLPTHLFVLPDWTLLLVQVAKPWKSHCMFENALGTPTCESIVYDTNLFIASCRLGTVLLQDKDSLVHPMQNCPQQNACPLNKCINKLTNV